MSMKNENEVIDLNVGGHVYTTTMGTLTSKYPNSKLALSIQAFRTKKPSSDQPIPILQDSQGRIFIDRDGSTFRYILDYLRRHVATVDWITKMVPSSDRHRFRTEAVYYDLDALVKEIDEKESGRVLLRKNSTVIKEAKTCLKSATVKSSTGVLRQPSIGPLASSNPYFISIGYRGYYTADRDSPSNDLAKFRKITRITVSGRSDVAKEVFSEELNESRDPERFPPEGYTCRYYLTHTYLEYAFETLVKKGFELVTSCSTGNQTLPTNNKDDFKQWSTFVEYLFFRKPNYHEQQRIAASPDTQFGDHGDAFSS